MSIQHLIDAYFERAQDLDNRAQRLEENPQRVEQIPPAICLSPPGRDATFLRREAMWWRAYAEGLAKAA